MNNVNVLDCTLRDGGYCNQWQFGYDNIKKIISGLLEAKIDIVECGFLTNRIAYDNNSTKFTDILKISEMISDINKEKFLVAMINYGEYELEDLPLCDNTVINGIRVAFHKKDLIEALNFCEGIKKKGYKVFVQAMVSLNYSDAEFLSMIQKINEFKPYAFYIVDSFGTMKWKELTRFFYLTEHNLDKKIWIGFHSHNNMQLAYSNAQGLINMQSDRNLIIDSSVYGMGRGAGNLNTELFLTYLNENMGMKYKIKPLLTIIDEILSDVYKKNYWGYSLPNYLSAVYNAHPNYAEYLDARKTLTVEGMNNIFKMMDAEKKITYDKKYIEKVYYQYMKNGKIQEAHRKELQEELRNNEVLLIAPGKSSTEEKIKIIEFIKDNRVIVISVNFDYSYVPVDYIFVSNQRRYRELNVKKRDNCIVTSNIVSEQQVYLQTQYSLLLNEEEAVRDNAGMMAIKFLLLNGVKKIYLAGFDGYSHDVQENYGEDRLTVISRNDVLDAMNNGIKKVLTSFADEVKISFLTMPRHIII